MSSDARPRDSPHETTCRRMSEWPRCTPSNVPTVTTVPFASIGSPIVKSDIAQHEPRLQIASASFGYANQIARPVHKGDALPDSSCHNRIAMKDARECVLVQLLNWQR